MLLAAAVASLGLSAPAWAQDAANVLAVVRAASGSAASRSAATVELDYAYSGQGLTGQVRSVFDAETGDFIDISDVGPVSQTTGFDGATAWMKDPSGAVTPEAGGDTRQLAVNEAYRNANLWWRPGAGGASLTFEGRRAEGASAYDIVTVAPVGGKRFEAWFDATPICSGALSKLGIPDRPHHFSDYRPEDGLQRPHKVVVDNGDGPRSAADADADEGQGSAAPARGGLRRPQGHADRLVHRQRQGRA